MLDLLFLRRGVRRAVVPLVCAAVVAYLGYHAFIGKHGIYTHLRLEDEAEALRDELADLKAERATLEHRIALINTNTLDRDMLDERVRAVLNFAHPDEIIILKRTYR